MNKLLIIPLALTVILSVAADALPEQFRWDDVGGTNFVTPVKSQTTADDRSYAYAPLDCLESMRLIYRQTSYAALTEEEQAALIGPAAQLAEAAYQKPGDFDRQWYNNGWPCVFKSIDWMLRSGVDGRRVTDVFMMSPLSYEPDTVGWWGQVCSIQQTVSTYGPIVAQYQHLDACLTDGKYYRFPELAPTDWNRSDFSRSVVIVGYDDHVPASKFSDAGSFGTFGDGAWIAKSSYGNGFGENGYFYISYYDCSLFRGDGWHVSAYWNAFALDHEKAYGSFYAHELECPSNFEGADYYSYAAMFTAEADGVIGAVGVMAFGGGRFKVSAFVGCSEGDPVSGMQVLNRDEHYVDALGYHAIGLKTPFAVKKGERFSVIIDSLSGHGLMQLSNPVPGQCFRGTIEYDDDPVTEYKWEDMAYGVENWYGYANACYVTAYALSAPNDFVVKSEPVDVGRLMAHSTAGSEDFWEEAEASFGISKYTFTATPGAIPTANESEDVCSVAVAPESGNYTFTVEASANWTVISDCSWMRVSQGSGAKGTSPIDVTVDANAEGVLRKGELVFTCDRKQRRFVIVQDVMPKVVSWDVYGKDTEEEYVPPGGNKGAPCLVAGRSYIVKLQFSPFNRMRYPVSSIRLQGRASRAPAVSDILDEWQQPVMADGSYVVELESKSCLPKGPGCHGPYDFALEVDCEPFGSIDVSEKIVAKKVFFDKYEKDNRQEPNWFVYWYEDGAVPGLSYGEQYRYSEVDGYVPICKIDELDEAILLGQADKWGRADPITGHVTLHARAAGGHYYSMRKIEVGELNFSQPWVYGIYTVANVLAHERQHIETYDNYIADLQASGVVFPPKTAEDQKQIKNKDGDFNGNATKEGRWYFEDMCRKLPAEVHFCDHMTDEREEMINEMLVDGLKLDKGMVDTFDLGTKKPGGDYECYGDNEFMSMLAGYQANKDESTAREENDWAYPGHQSYLPNGVLRKNQVVAGVKQDARRLALAKSESPARVEESETPFVASNGVIVAVNGEAVSRGEADSLVYRLSFDVTGSETIRFVGYLIDPASNVVACAGATVELTASNNGCELSFPTNEIFASGFKGPYTLSGMIIYRVGEMDYVCECICRDLVTDWVNCGPSNPDVPGGDTSACSFAKSQLAVGEGENLELVVFGGNAEKASSVGVYLTYQTAAAADLDLKAATVDGVMPKGGLKFPLTLSWAKGEVTNRVIRIPVKADKLVEGDETVVFQLAAEKGQELGETRECKVVIRDANSSVTLQDAVLYPGVKLTNKGTGPWKVSPGNREDPDGSKGLYHLETPSMPQGGTSDLAVGALKAGTFYFELRFLGNLDEEIPSRLEIYDRDGLAGVVGHGASTREGWFGCASNEWTGVQLALGNVTGDIRFVFVQGSDPNVRAELSTFEWWTDAAGPWYCVRALRGLGQGRVSGSGLFSKGATAKLTATPLPGWRFDGWYAYDADTNRFLWSSKASVSVKVSNDLEVQAHFSKIPYVAGLADPADGGKVSGYGKFAKGKKVTLKATASKGYAFAGWYLGGELVTKSASCSFKATGEDADYRARFVTLAEDKASIGATVNGMAFGAAAGDGGSTEGSTNAMCGVALFWPLSHGALSATSVKVSGLPKGLKYDTKKKAITGVPTAPGKTSSVKVVVTTAGKQKATFVLKVTVDPLPEWARGQFTGTVWPVAEGRDSTEGAVLTMTVGSTGKVSGKFKDGITNWTFSASSFATNSVTAGMTNLLCRATAKGTYKNAKKKTVTVSAPIAFELVARPDVSPIAAEGLGDFADGSDNVEIWRMAGVRVSVGEAGGGTVKMDKSYGQVAAGGKVKLTATVKKGYAFLGWYDLMTGDTEPVSQATTYALVSDGATDRFLEARFVKETELSANDITLEWNAPTDIFVGVSYSAKPTVRGRAAVKIASVSGLPKGLSWKSGKISGVPTTVKSYAVKVKVALTTNSKKAWTISVPIEVRALPEWATRTFEGDLGTEDEPIPVTVTIASNGKVSGKYKLDGANWTFSAKSFSSAAYDAETGEPQSFAVNVTASATISRKKKSQKFVVTVTGEGVTVED